ncbi:MAG: penicillin-binding protein activator [Zavarzinia sp.]|nr:penicillin-binding protein activator [Zavarzinia sp.]
MHPLAKTAAGVRRPLFRSSVFALAGLVLAACTGSGGNTTASAPSPSPITAAPIAPAPTGNIQIGVVMPATGQAATVGQALQNAAQLALFDLGAPDIELLQADAGASAATAVGATQNVLGSGAGLVIGPLGATSVKAAAGEARRRGVPMLGFSTDRSAAGNGVYLMGFMPEEQVSAIVAYAAGAGMTRFAALLPSGAYGDVAAAAFDLAVGANGGTVVHSERYRSGSLQPSDTLRALVTPGPDGRMPVDAIFVPEGGAALRQVTATLAGLGFDGRSIRLLGTDQWSGSDLGSDPLTLGGWFAGPAPDRFERFAGHYQSTFGDRPPRIAAQAYDAMTLAVLLARQPGGFADSVRGLASPDGFAGVDGLFRFRADGTPQHGLAILEVTGSGPRVIRPAPDTFVGQGF